jgi:hypothetical protein
MGGLKTLIELEDGSGARSKYTLDTAGRKLTIRNHSCDNLLVAVGSWFSGCIVVALPR